ncbi:MAG: hypothetical protein J6S21_05480, partial [Victivallales bacterium]|nr:hypothetical protein [Victivallales bacterium]
QKQLAMCALLHHATISDTSEPILELYRENRYWMDTVVNYNRHHAPGEGWTLTDNEEVGFAYYEDGNGGRLHVFANLSDREVTVNWETPRDGRTGTITLPPMKITVEKR